jgi:GNAT superfamily N-acetyltransferase
MDDGSVRFQCETAHALWGEIEPLLEMHWREIAHYQDIPLAPDADFYNRLEEGGVLRCFTCRVGEELVGYSIYIVQHNPHYRTSKQAKQDVLFLAPEYRRSRIGLGLLRFADDELRAEGVQVVYQHCKAANDLGPLLRRMDYELVDYIYARRLDR